MSIAFTKMNSQGNDFIIVDNTSQKIKFTSKLILSMCSRDSIGCDQLLVLKLLSANSVECIIFNQDSTEAKQCGNGLRAVMLYLKLKHNLSSCSICIGRETYKARYIDPNNISVEMGPPLFVTESPTVKLNADFSIEYKKNYCHVKSLKDTDKLTFSYAPISVGNFHCIVFSSDCFSQKEAISDILTSIYDDGANISFLLNYDELIINPNLNLIIRVNERGSGWTKSCGSAASAAGAFCIHNFLREKYKQNDINVEQEGGVLNISWSATSELTNQTNNLTLVGPSTYEYDDTWNEKL